jgi:hypothetical protein
VRLLGVLDQRWQSLTGPLGGHLLTLALAPRNLPQSLLLKPDGVLFGRLILSTATLILPLVSVYFLTVLVAIAADALPAARPALAPAVLVQHEITARIWVSGRAVGLVSLRVSAVPRPVKAVLARRAPLEVPRGVVELVTVKMARYQTVRPRAMPRFANELVDRTVIQLAREVQPDAQIAVAIKD